jgi:hypothetical protein
MARAEEQIPLAFGLRNDKELEEWQGARGTTKRQRVLEGDASLLALHDLVDRQLGALLQSYYPLNALVAGHGDVDHVSPRI